MMRINIPHVPFPRLFKICGGISLILCLLSLSYLIYEIAISKNFNWGTDFVGGIELQVKFKTPVTVQNVREALAKQGFDDATVFRFGEENSNEMIILRRGYSNEKETLSTKVLSILESSFGKEGFEILRVDEVGPRVGQHLKFNALISIVLAHIGILIYVWMRFSSHFAPGAIISLVHDVLITFGFFALTHHEFELTIVAALLTIVGFSINDTIVIFDRIRDNLKTARRGDLTEVVDTSLNETLSRTILTNFTALLAISAIFLVCEGELKDFAMTMIVGFIAGTYSSLFVAAPIFIWSKNRSDRVLQHA